MKCIDSVAAVEREEVDQVELQLPSQLEVDPPADVPPAQERVQDVELALLQLADLVDARRPPEHVAAEVGVEAQRRLERQQVAIAVVAAQARGRDVEHVQVHVLREPAPRQQLVVAVGAVAAHLVALPDRAQVDRELVRGRRDDGSSEQASRPSSAARRPTRLHALLAGL